MDLKALLESTADGAFAVDQRLKIVYWNQAAHDMLGFGASDVIGHRCYEVLGGLDEDNRPFCKAFCSVSKAVAKHEPVASNEIQALTSRGDRRWLNMSVVSARQGPEAEDVLMATKQISLNEYLAELEQRIRTAEEEPQDPWQEARAAAHRG